MNFADLGLSPEILKAIEDVGYSTPTPIQEQAIPYILMGRDVLGSAQTGTGKTASFTLPMIDILARGRARARMPRSLILEPTRELATQVAESFERYGKHNRLSMALLIGGESFTEQERRLNRGVDVLIATPGRLLDLFERGKILLADVKVLVIDEADRMLDMGFIPDVERIVSMLPRMRQTLFFSATMPAEIRRLTEFFLINPKVVTVDSLTSPAESVSQNLIRVGGPQKEKRAALRALLRRESVKSALIFCNRKRDVGILYRSLERHGFSATELHGDLPQPTRMDRLDRFKQGKVPLLVCSDVAARGLDISDVSHVINFDVPVNPEDYIHRIGRTGRAGRTGQAFTLALPEEAKALAAVTNLIRKAIPEITIEGVEPWRNGAADGASRPVGRRDRKTGERAPAQSARSARGRRSDRETPKPGRPKTSFGDHTPAFLLRRVPLPAGA